MTVTATDSSGYSGSATFAWTITNTVTVTNPGAQTDVSGTAITTLTPSASDSSSATIASWSATGLPAGLSIDGATGDVTGTPTTACSCSVTLTATDSSGYSGAATFSWTVTNSVTITAPADRADVSGTAITPLPVPATDSSSTATLAYTATGLPLGLGIDATTGTISGSPTTAGIYSVTVTATDDAGYSGSASFAWTITDTVSVTGPGDQSDLSGTPISPLTIAATDSSTTATIGYLATGLPDGLSIDPATGTVTGTPTTAGTSTVTVSATDSSGATGSTTFSWSISNTIALANPGDQTATSGSAITALDVGATDTSPTATVGYTATGLPPGLSIDADSGSVSGTPTTAGSYTVTVTATDDSGASTSVSFGWTIGNVVTPTVTADQSSVSGSAIAPLTAAATDSSSTTTLTYGDGGSLPTGLSIDATSGVVTGTPTTAGAYAVVLTATDGAGFSATDSFSWTVTNSVTTTGPGHQSTVSGTPVTPVTVTGTDSSSTATLTFTDGGTLPPGLVVDPSSGTISGTPTTGGDYPVTITATDGAGFSASWSFGWTITNHVVETPIGHQTNVSGAAVGPISAAASDTSSTATLAYSAGGSLPVGVSVDASTGSIAGTPTTAGVYPVTITATDSAGFSATTSFTWTIINVVTVPTPSGVTDVTGSPISPRTVAATDSSSTATLVSWSATGLPTGLSIDTSTGTVTGTPTTAGNYFSVTVTVTDSVGFTGSTHFAWAIGNLVTVSAIADQTSHTAHPVTSIAPSATDSQITPAVTFTWSATGLPPGIAIDRNSGTISGTPTAPGTNAVTVTATDGATPRQAGSVSFTWTVTTLAPVVTSLTPTSGPGAGGTIVKISGTDLQGASSVLFGSTPATISNVNATGTLVTVVSPAHPTGAVDVTVTAGGGTSAVSGADHFTYLGPVITGLTPASGPTVGGGTLKIVGTGLAGPTSVTFGSAPATVLSANRAGTLIKVTVPAGSAGVVTVTVTNVGGTSAATSTDRYTYVAPSVISVTPSHGPRAGGTMVTIAGTSLGGATSVHFGSVSVTTLTVNAAGTRLRVQAPAGTAGTVDVTVTTPGGTTPVVTADRFTYT